MAKEEKPEEKADNQKSLVKKRIEQFETLNKKAQLEADRLAAFKKPSIIGSINPTTELSVDETVPMPTDNTQTVAQLNAIFQNEPEVLYTVSQELNGRMTFIVHRAASSEGKGHYTLKEYIDAYKNLPGQPVSSVIIKMPDGLFQENLAPLTEPLTHSLAPLYTFTITEQGKEVILGMDIPTLEASNDEIRLGLNKCKLYAIGLSEDLDTKVEVSIKGKDIHIPKIEDEYNKEKIKIRTTNNRRVIILGLAMGLAVCIGIALIALAVILPYTLGPVIGSAFAIAGPILLIGPLYIPVFFPEALTPYILENDEHGVTALYDKQFSEKISSKPTSNKFATQKPGTQATGSTEVTLNKPTPSSTLKPK